MLPTSRTENLSKVVIITGRVDPHVCGIGDYSINLSAYCKTQINLSVNLIVEKGCHSASEPVIIVPCVENWSSLDLQRLVNCLEAEKIDTVILQYAPWLYSSKGYDLELINFWQQCAQQFQTLLIAHETYFWFLRHPGTWAVGLLQQYVLRSLVHSSHHVFSGCELYLQRLKRFSNHPDKIHYLPIPSNISPQPLSTEQKQQLRQKLGIAPHQIVLTLFGCFESIRQDWIQDLDGYLNNSNYSIVWLLLGSAKSISVPLENPTIRPGYLNQIELSHYLQISSLMLMPHRFGISAKRTSLMSGLEHGLPVVGTDGFLTDSFLRQLPSIFLANDGHYPDFEAQLLNALTKLPKILPSVQMSQNYYQNNLSWHVVTQKLLPYLQN